MERPSPVTGWEPETPVGDTLVRRQVFNLADRFRHTARCLGAPYLQTEAVAAVNRAAGTMWGNDAVLLRPLDATAAPSLVARLDEFYTGLHWFLWSPWPTPDLTPLGLLTVGHPPLMLRPPGGAAPPDPPELSVTEVEEAADMAAWERVVIEGFPLPGLEDKPPGTLYDHRMLAAPFRAWLGRWRGRPVTAAAAFTAHGVVQVEWVATLAEARRRGFGEAVTWRATLADPSLPAVLVASDLGRPVYERMGYLAVTRYTMWIRLRS